MLRQIPMKIFGTIYRKMIKVIALLSVIASLIFRIIPQYTFISKRKKVLSKKVNAYIYQSLKARIYALQVLGTDPTSSDYPDS